MGIKINIGVTKKIGTPNYGSRGASCNAEFELDGSFDNGGAVRFQEAATRAYQACRAAVEAELSGEHDQNEPLLHAVEKSGVATTAQRNPAGGSAKPKSRPGPNGESNARRATASQVRAIHAIASRQRIDLKELLPNWYQVANPEDLSIGDASLLIDELKSTNGETANGSQKGPAHDGSSG